MTRTEFLTAFLKKSMCPVLLAAFLYNVFFHLAVQYGTVNYMYLLMLCGIPFGIRFMFLLPVFFGNLGAGIAMTCFNIAIGALIGGFVLLWKFFHTPEIPCNNSYANPKAFLYQENDSIS